MKENTTGAKHRRETISIDDAGGTLARHKHLPRLPLGSLKDRDPAQPLNICPRCSPMAYALGGARHKRYHLHGLFDE